MYEPIYIFYRNSLLCDGLYCTGNFFLVDLAGKFLIEYSESCKNRIWGLLAVCTSGLLLLVQQAR
jgi:hypothetical protein